MHVQSLPPVAAVRPLSREEAMLEQVRLLILGGILIDEHFDRDDLPIADRIAAANEHALHP
jgi:hypothetical protein